MNREINEYHVIEGKSHPLTKMEDIIEDVHVSIQAFYAFLKHMSVFIDRKKTQMSASAFCTLSPFYMRILPPDLVLSTFKLGFPISINQFYKTSHRNTHFIFLR